MSELTNWKTRSLIQKMHDWHVNVVHCSWWQNSKMSEIRFPDEHRNEVFVKLDKVQWIFDILQRSHPRQYRSPGHSVYLNSLNSCFRFKKNIYLVVTHSILEKPLESLSALTTWKTRSLIQKLRDWQLTSKMSKIRFLDEHRNEFFIKLDPRPGSMNLWHSPTKSSPPTAAILWKM